MKAKKIVTILLLVFIAGSIVFMIAKESKTEPSQDRINPPESEVSAESNDSAQAEHKTQIIVYYFHGDMRCVTCQRLQNYAKEALDTYFEKELASGEIIWSEINVDRAENRHFIQDYSLVTKSVVLSKVSEGKEVRSKNLDKVWNLLNNKDKFYEYIKGETNDFINQEETAE